MATNGNRLEPMSTRTRALELLGLLQNRRHWPGDELARRLGVSQRTLRRDVNGLQELGYPITTTRGTGGGYQLVPGASLPPLVLSEDEATAVVLGLKEIASANATPGEAAVSAMAKIVQVLPTRIRHRIDSLRGVVTVPMNRSSSSIRDVTALTTVALASRDHEVLRFHYHSRSGQVSQRLVQPHRSVSVDQRLYLIAWDLDRADWRTFRIDRIENPVRTGRTFVPRQLPEVDPVEFVHSQIRAMPTKYSVRATVWAPEERVKQELARYGGVHSVDDDRCEVRISAESLDWAAFCLAAIGAPFTVHGPPEAIEHLRGWGARFTAATEGQTR